MARSDTGSRIICATSDHVFAALLDPEALTAWLPPEGMSGRFERFDPRPGGSYRLVLTYADPETAARGKATADSDVVDVRFVDIVPGVRVVQAVDFVSDDTAYAGTMTMTWEVTAVDAATRVDIRADDVPAGITAEDHAAGLASSLANLAAYLEGVDQARPDPATAATMVEELEAHRAPLTGYCYRILGSAADTEDAVQETLIRAHRRRAAFDPNRGRLTTWLHAIATNVCLDMLRGASRRALTVDLGPASESADLGRPLSPDRFIDPMPDARLFGVEDPAERAVARETLRFAFIAALQRLSPRQRAALVLRDVLAFSAKESAEILDSSVASVNSALQRARAVLAENPPAATDVLDPDDAEQRELLARYVAAFEAHDIPALTALLREDATSSMPPFAWWLRGADRIAGVMADSDACAGDRLLPTAINGSPGFGQYRPGADGRLEPFALLLVEVVEGQVAHLMTFLGSQDRFAEFDLPQDVEKVAQPR